MHSVTALELQSKINELVDQVTATGEPVVIGDADKPTAALVSAADYEILRRIEDAADRELIARIKAEGGEPISWGTLKAELGL